MATHIIRSIHVENNSNKKKKKGLSLASSLLLKVSIWASNMH